MIDETMDRIADRIRNAETIPTSTREELLALVETLKDEVDSLPSGDGGNAESLGRFMELSAHEATRPERNADLLELALSGLSKSVEAFESSHPRLADAVNGVCGMLSGLGI
jgi:hypothetical protein